MQTSKRATLLIDLADHIMDLATARPTAVVAFHARRLLEESELHQLSVERSIHSATGSSYLTLFRAIY